MPVSGSRLPGGAGCWRFLCSIRQAGRCRWIRGRSAARGGRTSRCRWGLWPVRWSPCSWSRGQSTRAIRLIRAIRWTRARFCSRRRGSCRRQPPRAKFKNVLLVSLDTLRSDRMSAYGAALPTTPRMAALADTGVRFNTARAPASSTPPSHMTMLTGASPCTHGVWGVHVEDQPPVDLESLAQILSREGYSTRAVTENAFVGAPWGFCARL